MDESDADAFEVEINAIELETIIDDSTFDYTESDAASTSDEDSDSDEDEDDTSYADALLGDLFDDEDEENSNEASDDPVSVAMGHLLASEEERIKAKQEYDRLTKEVDMCKRMMWYINRPEVLAAARLTQQMGCTRQNVGTQVRMSDLVDEEYVQNSSGSEADYEDDDEDDASNSEETMGHPNWPMLENWYLNQMAALRGVEEEEEEEFEAEDGEDTDEDEDSDQENVIYFDDGGEMYAATRQPEEMVEDEEAGYDAGDEAHFEVIDLEQEEAVRARGEPHVGPVCKRMRTE